MEGGLPGSPRAVEVAEHRGGVSGGCGSVSLCRERDGEGERGAQALPPREVVEVWCSSRQGENLHPWQYSAGARAEEGGNTLGRRTRRLQERNDELVSSQFLGHGADLTDLIISTH